MLSVVIPMYNEEDVLPLLVDRLQPVLEGMDATYEVLAVDDGSTDLTPAILQRLHREWPQLRVVRLRANAGHQAAISAGLQRARGDFIVTIDADLQDPPEVIAQMLAKARGEGVDVVYGVRNDRSTDSWFKRVSAKTFYRPSVRCPAARRSPTPATSGSCPAPRWTRSTTSPSTTACCGSSCRPSGSPPTRSSTGATSGPPARRSTRSSRCSGCRSTP